MGTTPNIPEGTTAPRGISATASRRWLMVRVGEHVVLRYGKALQEPLRRPGTVPVYGSNGRCGWHDESIFEAPGIVLGRKGQGPLGVEWVSQPFWVIDTAYAVSVDHDCFDLRYFYYLAKHVGLNHLKDGVSNPSLTRERFYSQAFPRPGLVEQRRIAAVLSAYDDLIENNAKRIRVLEEMAQRYFTECFRDTDRNGWESKVVTTLIQNGALEVNDGYRAKNVELGTPGIPFARAGDINGGFLFDDADSLAEDFIPRAGRKVSQVGDIVFTSKGTVGRFAWVRERTPTFVYSPQLCYWRVLRPEVISVRYVYRWMQTRAFLDQVDQVKGSTDMADYVSLTNQRRMTIEIPPADLQVRYDDAMKPVDDLVANLTDRNHRLRAARDLLLPKLLSGELSVDRIPDPAAA